MKTEISSIRETLSRTIHISFKPNGWASLTISDDIGEFSIQSAWGSWSYRWHADPRLLGFPTLSKALVGWNDIHYIAGKLKQPDDRIVDPDQTLLDIRRRIIEDRKSEIIDREQARDLWQASDDFREELCDTNPDLALERADGILWDWDACLYEDLRYRDSDAFKILKEVLLPTLIKHLQQTSVNK